jgi:hypothetical protein
MLHPLCHAAGRHSPHSKIRSSLSFLGALLAQPDTTLLRWALVLKPPRSKVSLAELGKNFGSWLNNRTKRGALERLKKEPQKTRFLGVFSPA